MRKKRHEAEAFGLSFLDVITSAFGAMILLLLIAKPGEDPTVAERFESQTGVVADLQARLYEIRGQANVLGRDLAAKREQLSTAKEKTARWESELSLLQHQEGKKKEEASADAAPKERLQLVLQELTEEMQRLLAQRRRVKNDLIAGIPVDSEYIIFVIDTSGSMFQMAWQRMIKEMVAVLEAYPQVKGIQILNDMGGYMFSSYGEQEWIPDTPARRRVILERLRTWNPFSNSSPVEGIEKAIRAFYRPDRKISIYVFGDDFTGPSIHQVIAEVDRLNPKNSDGNPQIRIHAVGFPVQFANPYQQVTGMRFAALMRELAHRNRGTFVGLNDFRIGN